MTDSLHFAEDIPMVAPIKRAGTIIHGQQRWKKSMKFHNFAGSGGIYFNRAYLAVGCSCECTSGD